MLASVTFLILDPAYSFPFSGVSILSINGGETIELEEDSPYFCNYDKFKENKFDNVPFDKNNENDYMIFSFIRL